MKMKYLFCLLWLMSLTTTAVGQDEEVVTITPDSVIQLTNQERAARGLPPLRLNEKLARAAYAKAKDMFEKQYFAHQRWEEFIRRSEYRYCSAGENLGLNHTEAQELVRAWMDSPSHRANLLKGKYREIGVAVVRGKYKSIEAAIIIVQVFGARCS